MKEPNRSEFIDYVIVQLNVDIYIYSSSSVSLKNFFTGKLELRSTRIKRHKIILGPLEFVLNVKK